VNYTPRFLQEILAVFCFGHRYQLLPATLEKEVYPVPVIIGEERMIYQSLKKGGLQL
jgi:hypothetical protein